MAELILLFLEATEIFLLDAGFFHVSKRKAIGRVTIDYTTFHWFDEDVRSNCR